MILMCMKKYDTTLRISHSLVDVLSQRLQDYMVQNKVRVTAAALLVCEHAKDSQLPLSPSVLKRPIPRFDKQVVHFQLIVPYWFHFVDSRASLGLEDFRSLFPNGKFYDLSQTPGQRARYGVDALPTLTRTCMYMWSEQEERYLRILTEKNLGLMLR